MHVDRVGFIGAGNITESLIRGIITSGCLDPGHMVISDLCEGRLLAMNRMLGPAIAGSNRDVVGEAELVFLAVKPAQVETVAREIGPSVGPGHLVVSVAAGTSLARVRAALGDGCRLCRIMPNLAASVRRSTIGLYAGELPDGELAPLYSLLSHLGRVFRVDDESLMAAITALSGSAPAYYVMMAEALVRFGVEQGMSEELASAMVLETMEGAAAWARQGRVPMGELWRRVVTPGGTTEAGIAHYDQHRFLEIFVEGLDRSTQRARELGDR